LKWYLAVPNTAPESAGARVSPEVVELTLLLKTAAPETLRSNRSCAFAVVNASTNIIMASPAVLIPFLSISKECFSAKYDAARFAPS
jgi:hypothetical protein